MKATSEPDSYSVDRSEEARAAKVASVRSVRGTWLLNYLCCCREPCSGWYLVQQRLEPECVPMAKGLEMTEQQLLGAIARVRVELGHH
jgi:hypothetical protein